MSQSLVMVPADNFRLPVSTSGSDHTETMRRSTDSSWSQRSGNVSDKKHLLHQNPLRGVWRHTIGIILLLATVILWTASNFLASVGVIKGQPVEMWTDGLPHRLSLLMTATPNHTLSPTSTHPSSPCCCYLLPQGGYGREADLRMVLFVNTSPPLIRLLLGRKSRKQ